MRVANFLLMVVTLLPAMALSAVANGARTSDAGRAEAAVGRLVMSGRSMCTGALIAPDLVLTAAHCLYNPSTGRRVLASDIEFQAGLRDGKARAVRRVVDANQHPRYDFRRTGVAQLEHDLALLTLQSPISRRDVTPLRFPTERERVRQLAVVSYTLGAGASPVTEYPCKVVARQDDTLVMSCEVEFGASGAPVLALNGARRPALVSVVSAKAAMGGRAVSVSNTVSAQTVRELMAGS